jgi:2,3-bisphosphoglycerate-independent phosphoglycerate mutase
LETNDAMPDRPRPLALIVLDGWGIDGALPAGDATELAKTPVFHALRERYPHAALEAAGEAVGLPRGVIGNSEVGHMNLGAGRVVWQDLSRISKAIADRTFFENPALRGALSRAAAAGRALHVLGLWSDAGVHSHVEHAYALFDLAVECGVARQYLHAFTDGRDSDPHAGSGYLRRFQEVAHEVEKSGRPAARIASVSGRYYAMDRDRRWERTKRAWDAVVLGRAPLVEDPVAAVEASYAAGVTDEFLEPFCVRGPRGGPLAPIEDGDAVVFFNFRADRARQLTRALTLRGFDAFDRVRAPRVDFVSMTRYDESFETPVAFPPQSLARIFPAVLAERGLSQLRVAETEKYAHVTYFFNGGDEKEYPAEERILVPSAKDVPTYDLKPEMRAREITDEAVRRIEKGGPLDFVCLNYANADMVGHSGKLEATERACEAVDAGLGRLVEAVQRAGGVAIVTADHGNAEQMIDPETGAPHTAHTTNPVPVILVDETRRDRALRNGKLADLAPTLLEILGLARPEEMTGRSLLA